MVLTSANTRYAPEFMNEAFEGFRKRFPAYDATRSLDELRATEYARLDKHNQVYLDYTGGGLYAESQLREHMGLMSDNTFGNPHSTNATSMAMTHLVESARRYVLEFFNASPDEYQVIFTQNSSGALKLVGESYPFDADSNYLLTFDNHNSVNGIREFAQGRGATVTYTPVIPPEMRLDDSVLETALNMPKSGGNHLFAFPAQSNFSGVQHPLEWIEKAQKLGWDVMLDAAAFVPTNRLDLSVWHPDFVDLSFYKICGYPTGVGCLIARKDTLEKLRRPWFAGGTITCASVQGESLDRAPGPAAYEDGTLNYLSLPAVEIGLRHIASVGVETIHARVMALTGWLIEELTALRHANGSLVIDLYGPTTLDMRGATIEVNFLDADGLLIRDTQVERLANQYQISLRAGCHCNPGAREMALGYTLDDVQECMAKRPNMTYEQFIELLDERSIGGVRASLGIVTNFADVYRYMQFAETFVDYTER
ncbi:MAG: aminotransferase class V-fold PLP-dependent enzyme [Chloroflexota bacterium]